MSVIKNVICASGSKKKKEREKQTEKTVQPITVVHRDNRLPAQAIFSMTFKSYFNLDMQFGIVSSVVSEVLLTNLADYLN